MTNNNIKQYQRYLRKIESKKYNAIHCNLEIKEIMKHCLNAIINYKSHQTLNKSLLTYYKQVKKFYGTCSLIEIYEQIYKAECCDYPSNREKEKIYHLPF